MKPRKAVIPAAGLGTRFLPATKVVPKELLPILDRPALEYVVAELADSGIEEIVLVIHKEKESIFDHFSKGGWAERSLRERGKEKLLENHHRLIERVSFIKAYQEEAKGLGHAVLCAKDQVGLEPFVVVLPDDLILSKKPCVRQLIDVYEKELSSIVAVEEVAGDDVKFYGIVAGEKMSGKMPFHVMQIVEKPSIERAPSRWAIVGRYVLQPEIFEAIENSKPGALGEIQLTDALEALAKKKGERMGLVAVPFEGERMDVGQPPGFLRANLMYALRDKYLSPKIRPILQEMLDRK